jgi:hypothetical protein
MKTAMGLILALVCVLYFYNVSGALAAQSKEQSAKSKETTKTATSKPSRKSRFRYRPPKRKPPKVRQGGGVRGASDKLPALLVMTPEHVGLTTRAQPSLFWFQDKATDVTFVFALLNEDTLETRVELKVTHRHIEAGINRIDLAAFGVKLDPNVTYTWSVGLSTDEELSSSDPFASGGIKRIVPSKEMSAHLGEATSIDRASYLAENAIWYDALADLARLIKAHPDDRSLRQARADLLTSAGVDLKQVASFDLDATQRDRR